jgi:hypothetical protein
MKSDFASVCIRVATRLLRARHADWARAMRAELDHVDRSERASWAFGCLIAAIQQRLVSMQNGTLRISRSVLLLELLACFLPITLGWLDVVFGTYGIRHLDSNVIQQHFLDTPLNTSILGMMIGAGIIGLIGPIGLFLALRAVTTGTGLRNRSFGIAMIAAVSAFAMASVILRIVAGPGAYAADASFIVLMIALPAAGIAHLMYLATPAHPTSSQLLRP